MSSFRVRVRVGVEFALKSAIKIGLLMSVRRR